MNRDDVEFALITGRSADVELLSGLLDRCRPADLHGRFGSPVRKPRYLEWLLPHHDNDLALVVLVAAQPCGVINLSYREASVWEVAVVVVPGWQGRGLAGIGLSRIAEHMPAGATVTGQFDLSNERATGLLLKFRPDADVVIECDTVQFGITIADSGGGNVTFVDDDVVAAEPSCSRPEA